MRPHEETFDALAGLLIDLAVVFLTKQGTFAPFGAFVERAGKLRNLPCEVDIEEPAEAMTVLAGKLRSADTDIGMILLDTRSRTPEGRISDAIMFIGEHRDGSRVTGYVPYTVEAGEVTLGEHYLEPEPPRVIFTASA